MIFVILTGLGLFTIAFGVLWRIHLDLTELEQAWRDFDDQDDQGGQGADWVPDFPPPDLERVG